MKTKYFSTYENCYAYFKVKNIMYYAFVKIKVVLPFSNMYKVSLLESCVYEEKTNKCLLIQGYDKDIVLLVKQEKLKKLYEPATKSYRKLISDFQNENKRRNDYC